MWLHFEGDWAKGLYQRGSPKSGDHAIMQAAQGKDIMEKQPNSRMCFVCGIDNPIGLHLSFYTDEEGRCVARVPVPDRQGQAGPSRSTRAIQGTCTGELFQPCWTSQLKFQCTLTLCRYD